MIRQSIRNPCLRAPSHKRPVLIKQQYCTTKSIDFTFLQTSRAPLSFWEDAAVRRAYFDWAAPKLGIKTLSDWYDIDKEKIQKLGGGGLLALHYRHSLPEAIQSVYPDHEWLPWKFQFVPRGFWNKRENRKLFLDWSAKQLGVDSLEKWYSIKRGQVDQLGGESLLVNYYGHSLSNALIDIYNDHTWDAWRFSHAASPRSKDQIAKLVQSFAQENHVTSLEDWYRVSTRQVKHHPLAVVLPRVGGLPGALKIAYPDHNWKISLFSVLGKKTIQQRLLKAVQKLFPNVPVEEDVHSSQITCWKTIRHLQFDVYVPLHHIALEYQGEQHFQTLTSTMRSDEHWQQIDAEKMALCQKYGITLIDVPYDWWDGSLEAIRKKILVARPDLSAVMLPSEKS